MTINRLNDGEPQSLKDYVTRDGIRFFKIKICGTAEQDLERLEKIWRVIEPTKPSITLDGNEAWDDAEEFGAFVKTLAVQHSEMFKQILYIEQPLNRASNPRSGHNARHTVRFSDQTANHR